MSDDTPQYILDFLNAVYEGNAALALASFNEEVALCDATKRIVALQAIVDGLPKTADGVPVVPGMHLYEPKGDTWWEYVTVSTGSVRSRVGNVWQPARHFYSTREAAEAAVQNAIDKADRAAAEAAKETDDG